MSSPNPSPGQSPGNLGPDAHNSTYGNHPERTIGVTFNVRSRTLYLMLFYLAILGIAIVIKWSYHTFDAENDFRDTISYVNGADLPLTSLAFWAGTRPFTLPLFYKLLGVGALNYTNPALMDRVSLVQSVFSLIAWSVLGITIALRSHNRWLRAVIFGMLLAFSLTYEISRWDMLLLSESLSFSFFALMLAGWIWLLGMPPSWKKSPCAYLVLAGVILITILFSFTRESNPYFVVMCASVLALVSLFRRSGLPRALALIYLVAAILVFFAQTASSNLGNRWQIYIYDQLALHLGNDQKFTSYFKQAGLPMIEALIKQPDMKMADYQQMILYDPELEPVHQWMKANGKAAYIGYLLSNPGMTISQPIINATQLLDGSAYSVLSQAFRDLYRALLRAQEFLPHWMRAFTRLLFPTMPIWLPASTFNQPTWLKPCNTAPG
jgi:hypothetical protein